jgi:hypothetical protein
MTFKMFTLAHATMTAWQLLNWQLGAVKLVAGSCLITPEKNPARFVAFKEICAASTFCSNLLTTKNNTMC